MKKIVLFLLLFKATIAFCQAQNITLKGFTYWNLDKTIHQKGNNLFTSIKPFCNQDIQKYLPPDTSKLFNIVKKTKSDTSKEKANRINIAPSFYLTSGYDLSKKRSNLETGIGLDFSVLLGQKFAIQTDYISSNSSYNSYLDSIINEKRIIPNNNYAYGTKLGWCTRDLNFNVSYNLTKYFNNQAGKGKNFFGEGYHSLLLSDNAASYPMFKITTTIWKIKYVNLYTKFSDISDSKGDVSKYKGKYSAMHYLSINITKRINFSFFESIIWQAKDSNNTREFDVNYLNPVVFYRPTEFSLGSPDNVLMGFNISYLFAKNQQLYAQVLLDEFSLKHIRNQDGWWANKQAYQLGLKSFDVFRISNLTFQYEYNYIRPYTYSHVSATQNYGHYNQAIAHPLGANLKESVTFLRYQYKHIYFETQFSYIIMGIDTGNVNYGGNIYLSYISYPKEYNNYVGQGVKKTIVLKELKVYYLLFPQKNWNLYLSISNLSLEDYLKKENTTFISIGISSFMKKTFLGIF